jgi:hypothetical protein
MPFINDPDILTDRLPQPYRRICGVLEEAVLLAVDDHIDADVALACIEDRENGLVKRTLHQSGQRMFPREVSAVTCVSLTRSGLPLFGYGDGRVHESQILSKAVERMAQARYLPVYYFNPRAPEVFRPIKPPPLLIVAGGGEVVAVNADTLEHVSLRLEYQGELLGLEVSGLQGAVLVTVHTADNVLKIYVLPLPAPTVSEGYLATLDDLQKHQLQGWLPDKQDKLPSFTLLAETRTKLVAMGSGLIWFTDLNGWVLHAFDPADFEFEAVSVGHRLLPQFKPPSILEPIKVRNWGPMVVTAMDAGGDDVVLGTSTGLVTHFRQLNCLAALPSHHSAVSAVAVLKADAEAASVALTLGQDGFMHLFDLHTSSLIFRGAICYPRPPPGQSHIIGCCRSLVFIGSGSSARVVNFDKAERLCAIDSFPPTVHFSDRCLLYQDAAGVYCTDASLLDTLAPGWAPASDAIDPIEASLPFEYNLNRKQFRHWRKDVAKTLQDVILKIKREDEEDRARKIRGN